MTDTEFNQQLAQAWIIEVEGELESVDRLLQEVGEECAAQPYEDDTIMNTLVQTGKGLIEAWTTLNGIFKDVVSDTKSLINTFAKSVGNAINGIAEFANNLKH